MFEVTADDISALADDDLRALVGRLCEAELRSLGYSNAYVTWGGNQDASDGGIDVRVELPAGSAVSGFVPRAATAFQVKKGDMPRSAILKEMKPSGTLRPAIAELVIQKGAYIIVSSGSSTSDSALRDRRQAMAEAVAELKTSSDLHFDFYDAARMSTWVRSHPGLIPWVRQKVGRTIQGWRSYGPWAYSPDGLESEYLADNKARLYSPTCTTDDGLSAIEGINHLRAVLQEPRQAVRLAGLSGVGKTRLVQALFDMRVGALPLDPALAVYTDVGDDPDPRPISLASSLVASHARIILIIDNCPPELHRRLSDVIRSPESLLSLVTVEFDVQDDEPEGTHVYKLDVASTELIEELIQRRFRDISPVDRQRIAEFSGGNARIAIALAGTLGKNESLGALSDAALFKRLFHQRKEPDSGLLQAAQACSLVYSFQGEDLTGAGAELTRLSAIIQQTPLDLYGHVAELKRRELIQQRGVWRAVLPQAIANRLAAMALDNIPFSTIEAQLIDGAEPRLIRSFARRIGYLHGSRVAQQVAARWLSPGGLLGAAENLNSTGRAMFWNIAPVRPELTLSAIERAAKGPARENFLSAENAGRSDFAHLLRSLAYDAELFERCIRVLVAFYEAEESDDHHQSVKDTIRSFFNLYFSGTQASPQQRIAVIDSLVRSGKPRLEGLGFATLAAMLQTSYFSSTFDFEFGARQRDYGYRPQNAAEQKEWFSGAITFARNIVRSLPSLAEHARSTVAAALRGLWTNAAAYDEIEDFVRAATLNKHWPEGWLAVRQTLRFDRDDNNSESMARLQALEELLRPRDLGEMVATLVLTQPWSNFDPADGEPDEPEGAAYRRANERAEALGYEVVADPIVFQQVAPSLIQGEGGRLWQFGRGLARGTERPQEVWDELCRHLKSIDRDKQNVQVFRGFLNALIEKDPALANLLLDNAVESDALAHWFPILQVAVPIDGHGVRRLRLSLQQGKSPVWTYANLALARATSPIPGQDLKDLLLMTAFKEGGFPVAVEILGMRLYGDTADKTAIDSALVDAGRELLSRFEWLDDRRQAQNIGYRLGKIAEIALAGRDAEETARTVVGKLKGFSAKGAYARDLDDLWRAMARTQPAVFLNEAFSGNDKFRRRLVRNAVENDRDDRANPLDLVPADRILAWCNENSAERYVAIADAIALFRRADKTAPLQWTDIALRLLDRAPDPVEVLKRYIHRFGPSSWSGSRASIIEERAALLEALRTHPHAQLSRFVSTEIPRLRGVIEQERRWEGDQEKLRDQSFE